MDALEVRAQAAVALARKGLLDGAVALSFVVWPTPEVEAASEAVAAEGARRIATSDPMDENQSMSARPTVEGSHNDGWAVGHLIVVAGPSGVGKSQLIRILAQDDVLRARLGVPKGTADLRPRKVTARRARAIDALILHYDLLRVLHWGIPAYECDPGLSLLDAADDITFLTLRTSPERLRAQVEQRRLARRNRRPDRQALHLMIKALYQDDDFVRSRYDLWLEFTARYETVTVDHFFVEVDAGYALTPVNATTRAGAGLSRALAARPT